jgi:5-methyltetrahydrofolate--homocysteine methyltransferase
MPLVVRELDRRRLSIPVLVGGAAINRSFGREICFVEEGRPYAGGVFYCKDAFEGLECIGKLADPASREDPRADGRSAEPAGRQSAEPAGRPSARLAVEPSAHPANESSAAPAARRPDPAGAARHLQPAGIAATTLRSGVVARCEDVPTPPFWGARTITSMPLEDVFARLDEKKLFRLSWGAKNKRGEEWEALHRDFAARLEEMKATALRDGWFAPQAVYGYFPAWSDGNDLLIADSSDLLRHQVRFSFPRQIGGDHLCLSDYFLPTGSPRPDVAGLQVVTVGGNVSGRFETMDSRDEYSEAYYFHGLAVQTAEAATLFLFARIQQELGLPADRGTRYAWGFGALPDVEEHRKVFSLLPAETDLGLSLTSAGQLVPEHSTAALVVHHPAARYFHT